MELNNILSLFDGSSGLQQALQRSNISYDNYFVSEIDKYAKKVTQYNFPKTIQLGNIIDLKNENLPKIDLICFGSPCTDFSTAGKMKGMSTTTGIEIISLEQYLELKNNRFEFEG